MLPYGSIYYHGAPAALQDIPLGTHLHGLFYLKDPDDKTPLPAGPYHRNTPESISGAASASKTTSPFTPGRSSSGRSTAVDLDREETDRHAPATTASPVGPPKIFDLLTSTRVLKGNGFARSQVAATGPGRAVQSHLGRRSTAPAASRTSGSTNPAAQLATAQQLERAPQPHPRARPARLGHGRR